MASGTPMACWGNSAVNAREGNATMPNSVETMDPAITSALDNPALLAHGHGAAAGASSANFARSLLHSLMRFKDGDFSSRLPPDLIGLEGKIADAFNEILAVSARRADETARVC